MLRRVVLPALIGLLAIGQVATGAVAASGIRADQRRAAAAAKERRAVAAYQAKLRPLALRVFDAVQPLQDVDDAFARPAPGLIDAQVDVLSHSGAVAALGSVASALKALTPPKTLAKPAAALDERLADLSAAARALAAATHAKADRTGYVAAFGPAYGQLTAAENGWLEALVGVYGTGKAPAAPSTGRAAAQGRHAPTRGGFILQADLACGRAGVDLEAVGDVDTLEQLVERFPKRAVVIRRGTQQLLSLKAPAADVTAVHRLKVKLQGSQVLPAALEGMAAAAKRFDSPGYDAQAARFEGGLPLARDVSRAFGALGAVKGCAEYWNVDELLAPSNGGGDIPT